jgi:hypothetical protein
MFKKQNFLKAGYCYDRRIYNAAFTADRSVRHDKLRGTISNKSGKYEG